jgi:hypothetical protein
VVIDHELRYARGSHRVGQRPEAADVADVDDEDDVDARECRHAVGGAIFDALADQVIKGRWPGCRVDDADVEPQAVEQMRERDLRPTSIAIGVDVGRECDSTSLSELASEPARGNYSGRRDAKEIDVRVYQ